MKTNRIHPVKPYKKIRIFRLINFFLIQKVKVYLKIKGKTFKAITKE